MKKTLLAVAVAAALPAAAFAQTNVTLYGIADAGIGWNDNDGPGDSSTMVVNSGYQSTSRFGIRGTEDLGSGLKATFNFEAGIDVDTGSVDSDPAGAGGAFFQRRSVVGLAGGFGEVRLGRDYTPGFSAAGTTDIMGYGLFANWLTFTAQGGIATRASNGIHYTGTFSGVTLRAMYAEGELTDSATTDSAGGDVWGLSAVWAGGPLKLQGYYQEVNNVLGDAVKQAGLGAGYDFGGFRLTLAYGVADADSSAVVAGGDKLQGLGLGAGIKLGTGELLAQVMQLKVDNPVAGGSDPKGTAFGIAYVHPLSKRTNLYATYGMMRNNATGAFSVLASDNSVAAGAVGADPKGFAVGVRHLF